MAAFRLRTLKISRPSRTRATCLAGYSATTLLPEQDKPAPSGPMSGVSWFAVSCGVRLSEVGVETFPKPRVAGSIPLAISVPLCSSPCHPLRNSQSGYDCARIPWHTPHPLPCHNDPLEGEKSFFHFPKIFLGPPFLLQREPEQGPPPHGPISENPFTASVTAWVPSTRPCI